MIRFKRTLSFLQKHICWNDEILDLGTNNPLADYLRQNGFPFINNTKGENLDYDFQKYLGARYITAFEIFEHMLAPYNILKELNGELICSVPLKVWFAKAYWPKNDRWNCHYHEFEKRQFDRLLEETGWRIIDSEVWRSPDKLRLGIRPFLRIFWPSYYVVYAKK